MLWWSPTGTSPLSILGSDAQQPSVIRDEGGTFRTWYTVDKALFGPSDRDLVPADGYDLRWDPARLADYYGFITGVEAVATERGPQLVTTGLFQAPNSLLDTAVQNTPLRPDACSGEATCLVKAHLGLSLWSLQAL